MAYYGFCKNCKEMVKLSFLNKCKKCGWEAHPNNMITDVEWNRKTESEKDTFIKGLDNKAEETIVFDPYKKVGPFEGQYLVYSIDGVRGRHIDIYQDKAVINTKATIGSVLTRNATDGEKTIYYVDCIGIQFKPSKMTIGYLQIETAAFSGNNQVSNFFNENSFTFDLSVISNEKMKEVADYVKAQIDAIKKTKYQPSPAQNNTAAPSIADELLKLKQLVDMGVLTQEEFDAKKKQLLEL